jgi:hypothetical protein
MLTASLLTAAFGISSLQPARADGAASTRNIILGAAAVAAGIIISQNVAHKRELAGTVAGYTSDGATVYADGRVAYANGASYYPGDRGQQIACRNMQCTIVSGGASAYNGYWQWNGSDWVSSGGPPAYEYPQNGYMTPPYYQYPPDYRYGGGGYNRYSAYASAYNAYYEAYKAYINEYYEHYNSFHHRSYYSSGEQVEYPICPGYAPERSRANRDYCSRRNKTRP